MPEMNDRSSESLISAVREGAEQWLEEEIRAMRAIDTSDYPLSPETDDKIRKALKRDRMRENLAPLLRVIRAAGFAVIFAAALFFAISMSVQPVRAAFWEAIVNWYGEAVSVHFTADRPLPDSVEAVRYPSYIPAGWRLEAVDVSATAAHYSLTDDRESYVFVLQAVADETNESWFDREDITVDELKVNGVEARLLTHADGTLSLTWTDEYNFILTGMKVERDLLVRIAQSMK